MIGMNSRGAQQADGERGVGEVEDLHEQGDLGERAAQQRDRVQPPIISRRSRRRRSSDRSGRITAGGPAPSSSGAGSGPPHSPECEARGLVGVGGQHVGGQLGVGESCGSSDCASRCDHRRAAGGDPLVQQPRRALLRHQHEPPRVRVRAHGLEVGGERAEQVVEGLRELGSARTVSRSTSASSRPPRSSKWP